MKTLVELAVEGQITQEMEIVADSERLAAEVVRERIAEGQIVIPRPPIMPSKLY